MPEAERRILIEVLRGCDRPIEHVFIDMDGVLVDFIGGMLRVFEAGPHVIIPQSRKCWDWLGLTESEWVSALYSQGVNFWRDLPWTSFGMQIIETVSEIWHPSQISLLSKPMVGCETSYTGKALWVAKHLPGWADRLVLTQHKDHLARSGRLLIDDCRDTLENWKFSNGTSLTVPGVGNESYPLLRDQSLGTLLDAAIRGAADLSRIRDRCNS